MARNFYPPRRPRLPPEPLQRPRAKAAALLPAFAVFIGVVVADQYLAPVLGISTIDPSDTWARLAVDFTVCMLIFAVLSWAFRSRD